MRKLNGKAGWRELRGVLDRLVGKTVVRVVAGGAAGSIIGIHLDRAGQTPAPGGQAEWYLGVESAWRVDTAERPLASSLDDNAPGGPMLNGLNSLLGCVVSQVMLSEPAFDLAVLFGQGSALSVFCDKVQGGNCWYLLGPKDTELSVEPAGTLVAP